MKREIKFRAWDTVQKLMVAVTNMEFYDGELGWINTASFDDETKNQNDGNPSYLIPMQYTGLHDKNGREIYEGDIVRSSPRRQREKSFVGAVHYGRVDPSFTIHDKDGHDFRLYSSGEYRTYEVIGNIFEDGGLIDSKISTTN